jgi:hypothetical protein
VKRAGVDGALTPNPFIERRSKVRSAPFAPPLMSNVRSHQMRLVISAIALLGCTATLQASACAGAISVDISFAQSDSQLSTIERSKLELGVRQARAATGLGELRVALAIYTQDTEASSKSELNRLIERRVLALRESLALFGLSTEAVMAVRGDLGSLERPIGAGGLAEIEIAFGC